MNEEGNCTWYSACPTIIFHIVIEIIEADLGVGGRSSISSVGASVERDSAARESLCVTVLDYSSRRGDLRLT